MDINEAIKVIKDNWPESRHQLSEALKTLIPELNDSEDERIRKELISLFQDGIDGVNHRYYGSDCNRWITWLEKQGKKVDAIENFDTEFEKQVSYFTASAINKEHEYNQDYVKWTANALLNYAKHELEKQNEQKNIDKVEPKFKVGDFIINEYGFIMQIDGIDGNMYVYHVLDDNRILKYDITKTDESCHLWTIQDAKDGDVIFSNDGHGSDSIELIKSIYDECINFWFCLSSKNNFKDYHYEVYNGNIPYTNFASRKDATPATQEQRDLLFAKMKEAGYEWDAEKKELKKIKQKPAWSEEDERLQQCLIEEQEKCLEEVINNKVGHSEIISDLKEMYRERIDWLKSLKERYAWKPSDEQMNLLEYLVEDNNQRYFYNILRSLYEQLKKLKEE